MMKSVGVGLMMLAAGVLVALSATTGSVMHAHTPGTERSHVGELEVGKQALGGDTKIAQTSNPPAKKQNIATVNEKNDKQTVNVAVGDKVEITLKSNISTGYSWRLVSVSTTNVKQDGVITYVTQPLPPNSPPIVGRGGEQIVKFDAVAAGKATIKLEYARPWEKGKAPAQTFEITVNIK